MTPFLLICQKLALNILDMVKFSLKFGRLFRKNASLSPGKILNHGFRIDLSGMATTPMDGLFMEPTQLLSKLAMFTMRYI